MDAIGCSPKSIVKHFKHTYLKKKKKKRIEKSESRKKLKIENIIRTNKVSIYLTSTSVVVAIKLFCLNFQRIHTDIIITPGMKDQK